MLSENRINAQAVIATIHLRVPSVDVIYLHGQFLGR